MLILLNRIFESEIMKVAITGASGHVGNNLARTLLSQGVKVNALCHQDTRALEGLELERVQGSVLDPDSLQACFHNVEIVFHLASVISIDGGRLGQVQEINQTGTRFVVETCLKKGVRRLVHFSSIHALEQFPLDETLDETRPLVSETGTIYDQTKAQAERIVLEGGQHGLEVVVVSPTGIIGPHDYKPSLMGKGIIALYCGTLPALVPGGFDWVDVRDVIHGAIQACHQGISGERYLLSGHWISMKQMAVMIEGISGNSPPKLMAPFWLARLGLPVIHAYNRLNGTADLYTSESLSALEKANKNISHQKASMELDFHPRPLRETLEDTFQWYKQAEMLV